MSESTVDAANREAGDELGSQLLALPHVDQDGIDVARSEADITAESGSVDESEILSGNSEFGQVLGYDRSALDRRARLSVDFGTDGLEHVLGHEIARVLVGVVDNLDERGRQQRHQGLGMDRRLPEFRLMLKRPDFRCISLIDISAECLASFS